MVLFSKTAHQVAVLPYIDTPAGVQALLITSRRRGRWVLPKGWPQAGGGLSEAAAREAVEEAGLSGATAPRPVGAYRYAKRMKGGYRLTCTVSVYPLRVREHLLSFDEKGERRQRWMSLPEAARLADDRGLRRLLERLGALPASALLLLLEDPPAAAPAPPQADRSLLRALAELIGFAGSSDTTGRR
ncbi:MAG: NUDIX domain-containing protein [Marivibrio sp.]|uniref:NUDIX hydrolase n=1 Tax=Marivibrio sp. TaxID=2039719 RepID=UPI0032EEE5D1